MGKRPGGGEISGTQLDEGQVVQILRQCAVAVGARRSDEALEDRPGRL